MPNRTCQFEGCRNRYKSKGYCSGHNYQLSKGRELTPLRGKYLRPEERFWQKVRKTPSCWQWTGMLSQDGYGHIWDSVRGNPVGTHRFAYELLVGPIPDGHVIDHLCFNHACVNPAHLRPITHKQNLEHRRSARVDSKTGVRGVIWDKRWNGYIAKVGHNGETFKWGPFATIEEADEFVRAKRAEFFTHDDAIY